MFLENILSRLPGIGLPINDETVVNEVEAKRDRIKFHREKVRNGPVKFHEPSNGQNRRFQARLVAKMQRGGYRRQVKTHLAAQREGMILRGQLQAARVLPYFSDHRPTGEASLSAITWIVKHFADDKHADENGRVEVTEEVVRNALQSALNRWQAIVGMPATELEPGYVLPVAVAAA